MSVKISNRRNQIRRTTVSGVIPTIPTGTTSLIYPDESWATTDIMVGELFMNSTDSKIWYRDENDIYELGYSGQTGNFLALSDTPSSFTAGEFLIVNSAGTALTYSSGFTNTNTIVGQEDFYYSPTSADTGKSIIYDDDITGFTLSTINNTFLDLDDTPSGYTIQNYLLRINSGVTELEFFDGSNTFVDLTSSQSISGEKIFSNDIFLNGQLNINSDFILSGVTTTATITDIETNTAFTNVNNNTIATTEAIYSFVIDTFYGSGTTGTFVDLVSTQTITGEKTFSNTIISDLTATTINSTTLNTSTENIDLNGYLYFGDSSTDGSFRFYINLSGDLEIQKRESGTWVYKANF